MDINASTKMTLEQGLEYILKKPDGYAKLKLNINLHPTQKEVLKALFKEPNTKVSFRCGNNVGKSSVVAVVSILYALEVLNASVVSTAAVYRQITKQLIPYLKQYSHLYPNWEFLDNQIKINGETRYIGFSGTSDATIQGFHPNKDIPLLVIIDEAAGVDEAVYSGMSRYFATYYLVMGSPLGPEGVFYSIETEPNMYAKFKHFKLTQLECLKENGYWLDKIQIDDFIAMWGEENPLVQSSIYAEFATNIQDGIITLADIEKNIRNYVLPDQTNGKHVALDFAAGGAENVIAFRNGNVISIIKAWKDKDTMQAAYDFVNELNKLRDEYKISASDVSGDADGLGTPIIDRMKELGWDINRFHGNSKAIDDTTYQNRITECWLTLARKIRSSLIQIPNEQELKLQLTSRKQVRTSNGKLKLEAKADMAGRGVPSPDRADAVAMASSNPHNGLLTDIKTYLPSPKHYKGYF